MRPEFNRIHDAHHALKHVAHWLRFCPESDVYKAYVAVINAAEHAFALEHTLMESFRFPAIHAHLEQHARVLKALHCVHPAVMDGSSETARRVGGDLLTEWFQLHNETLDAAVFVWAGCHSEGQVNELDSYQSNQDFIHGTGKEGRANAFGNRTHN